MNDAPYSLACMEVWGGSAGYRETVRTPGLDVAVNARPHNGATHGGDLYYVSTCGAGNVARVAVADVSGHGESVREFSGALTAAMRRSINTPDQAQLVRHLNRAFEGIAGGRRFATALLATYFAPTSSLIIANAGHPPPMIRRADSEAWAPLDDADEHPSAPEPGTPEPIRDLPLGVVHDTEYRQSVLTLDPGDSVLLYTDACIEASDPSGSQLGVDGFAALLGRTTPRLRSAALLDATIGALDDLREGPADDDQTLVLIEHNGVPTPRTSLAERAQMVKRMMLGAALTGPGVG